MLNASQNSALFALFNILDTTEIVWALTGSTSMAIQGMSLVPNDIDIQTNEVGAYRMNELLKNFAKTAVSFSSTEKIRSHFGIFDFNGVLVEVMGDIQKYYDGKWEELVDLNPHIKRIVYKNMNLPVLNLEYESLAYKKLGRNERAKAIDDFLLG